MAVGKWVSIEYGDGRRDHAVPMRVEHLLTFIDLVNALAMSCRHDDITELSSRMSAAEVKRRVTDGLQSLGSSGISYWRDDRTDEEADLIEEWAEAVVRRVYGTPA